MVSVDLLVIVMRRVSKQYLVSVVQTRQILNAVYILYSMFLLILEKQLKLKVVVFLLDQIFSLILVTVALLKSSKFTVNS